MVDAGGAGLADDVAAQTIVGIDRNASRDREAAFDARVKSIAARFDRLTFKYTGPWPPYNFVNIRLKLERA